MPWGPTSSFAAFVKDKKLSMFFWGVEDCPENICPEKDIYFATYLVCWDLGVG